MASAICWNWKKGKYSIEYKKQCSYLMENPRKVCDWRKISTKTKILINQKPKIKCLILMKTEKHFELKKDHL